MAERRVPPPTITVLEQLYENAASEINQMLKHNIESFTSEDEIVQFRLRIKSVASEYIEISQKYSKRLLNIGRVNDSTEARSKRRVDIEDVNQVITTLNLLSVDDVSKFDVQSNRSGYSLSSQLADNERTECNDISCSLPDTLPINSLKNVAIPLSSISTSQYDCNFNSNCQISPAASKLLNELKLENINHHIQMSLHIPLPLICMFLIQNFLSVIQGMQSTYHLLIPILPSLTSTCRQQM